MDTKKLNEIYDKKFSTFDGVKSLGWGSEFSQKIRFKILLEINNLTLKDSILDVGCGHGDLSEYCENYIGIDMREKAIKSAKIKYPNKNFIICGVDQIDKKFDWVISSGIFCFKENWENNTFEVLSKMFEKSNKGVSCNFLSDQLIAQDDEMKYTNVYEIYSIINKITKKFVIRHDYLDNDITVYMYKDINNEK